MKKESIGFEVKFSYDHIGYVVYKGIVSGNSVLCKISYSKFFIIVKMYHIVYNGNASILEMLSETNQHNFFYFLQEQCYRWYNITTRGVRSNRMSYCVFNIKKKTRVQYFLQHFSEK